LLINLTLFIPLSFKGFALEGSSPKGEGEVTGEGAAAPLKHPLGSVPLVRRGMTEEIFIPLTLASEEPLSKAPSSYPDR